MPAAATSSTKKKVDGCEVAPAERFWILMALLESRHTGSCEYSTVDKADVRQFRLKQSAGLTVRQGSDGTSPV